MQLIFTPDESETNRATGYATVPYSSDSGVETVVETTEDDLAGIFEQAKADGETLTDADASIEAAIDEPLAYRDYLILEDNKIVFDENYSRNQET